MQCFFRCILKFYVIVINNYSIFEGGGGKYSNDYVGMHWEETQTWNTLFITEYNIACYFIIPVYFILNFMIFHFAKAFSGPVIL